MAQAHEAARNGDLEGLQACLAAFPGGMPALSGAESPLYPAALFGHAACVQALLAAGLDPNAAPRGPSSVAHTWRPLHCAASAGHAACVSALLAGGADPEGGGLYATPLFGAAQAGHTECVAALLAAGANPMPPCVSGGAPVHVAAAQGHAAALRLLLAARPDAAWRESGLGETPVDVAVRGRRSGAAQCLLTLGEQQPAGRVLALLGRHAGVWRQPLYASLAARQALTAAEWAHVPMPCAGIGAALPAVLNRSEAEAALLVCHLHPAERDRLQAAALCLVRAQRVRGLQLPGCVLGQLLALSAAD